MLLLYHFVLLLLSGVRLVFTRRAARIERKFARLAKEVNGLLRDPVHKQGNSGREDPYQAAKRQYLLGALVQKKDRLEAKHYGWAQRAEKVSRLIARLRCWKGRLVPYALGVVDVTAAICLVDYLTQGDLVSLRQLVGLVSAVFQA